MCARLHFNICEQIGVKLDKEHWYEHAPISVEIICEGKVNFWLMPIMLILWEELYIL